MTGGSSYDSELNVVTNESPLKTRDNNAFKHNATYQESAAPRTNKSTLGSLRNHRHISQ